MHCTLSKIYTLKFQRENSRIVACQFSAYFKNDVCFTIVKNSLERAQELFEGLKKILALGHFAVHAAKVAKNAAFKY